MRSISEQHRNSVLPYGVMIVNVLRFLTGHARRNEVELMLKTMLTESAHFNNEGDIAFWRVQLGGGPAQGIFQMEIQTARDLLDRYLIRPAKRKLATRIIQLAVVTNHRYLWIDGNLSLNHISDDIEALLINGDRLACGLGRVKYLTIPEAIPTDEQQISWYYKRFYNTLAGAGSFTKCEEDWSTFHGSEVMSYLTPLLDG